MNGPKIEIPWSNPTIPLSPNDRPKPPPSPPRITTILFSLPETTEISPMPHCEEAWNLEIEEGLKMYILIKEDTPADIVPLIAVHTAMGTYKKFSRLFITQKWFETELQKTVICKVTRGQFEQAKEYGEHFALTEVHHQELGELGLGFCIEKEYSKFFRFLQLYKTQ